jgi:hypothetical protein
MKNTARRGSSREFFPASSLSATISASLLHYNDPIRPPDRLFGKWNFCIVVQPGRVDINGRIAGEGNLCGKPLLRNAYVPK